MERSRSQNDGQLHFFFFPLMAQGHLRPIIDMARLVASRGQRSTIITTPMLAQSMRKLPDIEVAVVTLPLSEVGLSVGTDSLHETKNGEELQKFMKATALLAPQVDDLLRRHRPDCLVADVFFPWNLTVAARYGVPLLVFHATCFFTLSAFHSISLHKPHEKLSLGSDQFVIPDLPDEIVFTLDKLQSFIRENNQYSNVRKAIEEMKRADLESYGVVVNSFYELEPAYYECYTEVFKVNKAFHIGPLLLYNKARGENDDDDYEHGCLKWLDSKKPGSVVYICFGSLSNFSDAQLMEIATGLEASGKQFVWVVKKQKGSEEWLPEGFEERLEGKGLIIRGWAPQVKILEHEATGGFVTHCGWNSILEGICGGVPMVTWPLFAEQFYNEKLVCQVLAIGVEVGVTRWSMSGGDFVRKEVVESVVRRVMDGEEAEEMRSRVKKLAEMARRAVQQGGSSDLDLNALFQDLRSYKYNTSCNA